MLRRTEEREMKELDAALLGELITGSRLEEAAGAMNEKYREVSGNVLDVLEDLLDSYVTSSLRGDLADLRGLVGAGPPSRRSRLRDFLAAPAARNCLTAVVSALEKEVPHGVRMGFTDVSSFFRRSDFAATYHADIINYEPELRRLTDQRLVRLLSLQPNTLDLGLLDGPATEKKEQVLQTYREESLEPLRVTFRETATKCLDFLAALEIHALSFRQFFEDFQSRGFTSDEDILAEWSSLGEEFFHLEQRKSTLMLPISPKAVYWGMEGDYAGTLAHLTELKEMVTPDFSATESRGDGGERIIDVECLNPWSIKGEGFTIEPRLHYASSDITGSQALRIAADVMDPGRRYRFRIVRTGSSPPSFPLTFRISCEARFYPKTFWTEKHFLLRLKEDDRQPPSPAARPPG